MHLASFPWNFPLIRQLFLPIYPQEIPWGFTQIAFLLSFCWFSLNFTGGQSTIYQNNFKKWKLILWQRLNYVFQESHLAGALTQQTALVSRGYVWIKREPATPAHKQ